MRHPWLIRLAVLSVALPISFGLARADTSAGAPAAQDIDALINASGIDVALKLTSIATLFPRLDPRSDIYRKVFSCVKERSSDEYSSISRQYIMRKVPASLAREYLSFYQSPLGRRFYDFQIRELQYRLGQLSQEPALDFTDSERAVLTNFEKSEAARKLSFDAIGGDMETVRLLLRAHGSMVRECEKQTGQTL